jgi:hypothetical protein
MGWMMISESQPSQEILFSLLQTVYAGSEAYPASYSTGTRGSFSMGTVAGM